MPTWGWVVLGLACLAVLVLGALLVMSQQRTVRLRQRFGPEYDRTLRQTGRRRDAEIELRERELRRSKMSIRPLPEAARQRYEQDWRAVQALFVDDPAIAVTEADRLIQSVMRDKGYPVEDFDQRAEDLSVDHAGVIDNYREGHRLAVQSANRDGEGTEHLRRAMQHYRALFAELTGRPEGDGQDARQDIGSDQFPQGNDQDRHDRMVR